MYSWPQWNGPYGMGQRGPMNNMGQMGSPGYMQQQQQQQSLLLGQWHRGMRPQAFPPMVQPHMMTNQQIRPHVLPEQSYSFSQRSKTWSRGSSDVSNVTQRVQQQANNSSQKVQNLNASTASAAQIEVQTNGVGASDKPSPIQEQKSETSNSTEDAIKTVDMELEEDNDDATKELAPKNVQEQERLESLKEQAKNWHLLQQQQQQQWEHQFSVQQQTPVYPQMPLQPQTMPFVQPMVPEAMSVGYYPHQQMGTMSIPPFVEANFAPVTAVPSPVAPAPTPVVTSTIAAPVPAQEIRPLVHAVASPKPLGVPSGPTEATELKTTTAAVCPPKSIQVKDNVSGSNKSEQVAGGNEPLGLLIKCLGEFEAQLKQWNDQFDEWRRQNKDHPDKGKYLRFEKQWLDWRAHLIDRHLQMKELYNQQTSNKSGERTYNEEKQPKGLVKSAPLLPVPAQNRLGDRNLERDFNNDRSRSRDSFNEDAFRIERKREAVEISAHSELRRPALLEKPGECKGGKERKSDQSEKESENWNLDYEDEETEMMELARLSGYTDEESEMSSKNSKLSKLDVTAIHDSPKTFATSQVSLSGKATADNQAKVTDKKSNQIKSTDGGKFEDANDLYDPFEDDTDFSVDVDNSSKVGAVWFSEALRGNELKALQEPTTQEVSELFPKSVATGKRPALLATPPTKSLTINSVNKRMDIFSSTEPPDVWSKRDAEGWEGSQPKVESNKPAEEETFDDRRVVKFDDDCYVFLDDDSELKSDKAADPEPLFHRREYKDSQVEWKPEKVEMENKSVTKKVVADEDKKRTNARPGLRVSGRESRFEPRQVRMKESRFDNPDVQSANRSEIEAVKSKDSWSEFKDSKVNEERKVEPFTRRKNFVSRFEPIAVDVKQNKEFNPSPDDRMESKWKPVPSVSESTSTSQNSKWKPLTEPIPIVEPDNSLPRSTPTTPLAVGGAITRTLTEEEQRIIKQATEELKALQDLKELTKMLGSTVAPNPSSAAHSERGYVSSWKSSSDEQYGSMTPSVINETFRGELRKDSPLANVSVLTEQSFKAPLSVGHQTEDRYRITQDSETRGKGILSSMTSFDYGHKSTIGIPATTPSISEEPPQQQTRSRPCRQPFRINKLESIDYGHGQNTNPIVQITDKPYEDPLRRSFQPPLVSSEPTRVPRDFKLPDGAYDSPYIVKEKIVPRWETSKGDRNPNRLNQDDFNSRELSSRTTVKSGAVMIGDLISVEGRRTRPPRIVIIIRGPPGSSKTYVAKLIKDKEMENGGSAPRILSLDDYFMVEVERTGKDPETGKPVKIKVFEYEYEAGAEESYRRSLFKSFKKTVDDGFFPLIIVDAINNKFKHFEEMHNYAKQKGFQVYICEMDMDPVTCYKKNVHGRTLDEITKMIKNWDETPRQYLQLDVRSLLQDASITEVEMEDFVEVEPIKSGDEKCGKKTVAAATSCEVEDESDSPDLEVVTPSKWERMDATVERLDKLDGFLRVKRKLDAPKSLENYLQIPDDYEEREAQPGKKRVRWADIEESKTLEKRRALGFVVGQTNWSHLTDPNHAQKALTRTKYI